MAKIVSDLREEHEIFGKLFVILERQLEIFQSNGKLDYDLVGDVIDLLFHFSHRSHHPKEDAIFEKLALRDPSATSGMPNLKQEHGELHDLTRQFASNIEGVLAEQEIPREEVIKKLSELAEFQRRHMQMEEAIFLPTALKTLTPEDWAKIDAQFDDPNDPVFGAEAKSEFLARYEKIVRSP